MDMQLVIEAIKIIGVVAGTVGGILGVVWWIVRRYTKNKQEKIELLEGQLELAKDKHEKIRSKNEKLVQQLHEKQKLLDVIQPRLEKSRENEHSLHGILKVVTTERAKDNDRFEATKK